MSLEVDEQQINPEARINAQKLDKRIKLLEKWLEELSPAEQGRETALKKVTSLHQSIDISLGKITSLYSATKTPVLYESLFARFQVIDEKFKQQLNLQAKVEKTSLLPVPEQPHPISVPLSVLKKVEVRKDRKKQISFNVSFANEADSQKTRLEQDTVREQPFDVDFKISPARRGGLKKSDFPGLVRKGVMFDVSSAESGTLPLRSKTPELTRENFGKEKQKPEFADSTSELGNKLEIKKNSQTSDISVINSKLRAEFPPIELMGKDHRDPCDLLASSPKDTHQPLLDRFYRKLSPAEKTLFLQNFVPLCLMNNNARMLGIVSSIDMETGSKILKNVLGSLESSQEKFAEKLLWVSDLKPGFQKRVLDEFVGYGNVTNQGAMLTFAQIASRKISREKEPYVFNPTMLAEQEFPKYLEAIKASTVRPLRETFAIGSSHWISGIIEIGKNGKANILFIDSLGSNLQSNSFCIQQFSSAFPGQKIYHNKEKRQKAPVSCQVFALDDVRHLFNLEKYLKQGLFEYLDGQKNMDTKFTIEKQDIYITSCHLPLPFERSMQFDLENLISARPEKEMAINKKGQTAEYCRVNDFKQIGDRMQNRELDRVFNKFIDRNIDFLKSHSETEIQQQMQKFSLAAFQQRMAPQREFVNTTTPQDNIDSLSSAMAMLDVKEKKKKAICFGVAASTMTSASAFMPAPVEFSTEKLQEINNVITDSKSYRGNKIQSGVLSLQFTSIEEASVVKQALTRKGVKQMVIENNLTDGATISLKRLSPSQSVQLKTLLAVPPSITPKSTLASTMAT